MQIVLSGLKSRIIRREMNVKTDEWKRYQAIWRGMTPRISAGNLGRWLHLCKMDGGLG